MPAKKKKCNTCAAVRLAAARKLEEAGFKELSERLRRSVYGSAAKTSGNG